MRTRQILGSIAASTGLLIIGWQAGGAVLAGHNSTTSATPTSSPATTASSGTASSNTPAASTPATTGAPGATDGTYVGSSVNTRFGSVQVQVTIASGQITDVTALHLTDADGRSVQISNRAAPLLREEVLASQSASVSNISGATYTTRGYLSSLQSALDQAGL